MKTIIILLLSTLYSFCQNITFSDINFKNVLLSSTASGNTVGIGWNNNAPTSFIKLDANNDGEIQQSEVVGVTYLLVAGNSISNFGGLEYFTDLKYLFMSNNPIYVLNNLSTLTQLEILRVSYCELISIDLTGLISLKELECVVNNLASINFTGLPNLQYVECATNQITTLDFSGNPMFNKLICLNNPPLTSINIKNGTNQMFLSDGYCLFIANPNLNYICADASEIPIIQSFQATCAVNNSNCIIDSACNLGVEEFESEEVSVYPNPSSGVFNIVFEKQFETEIKIEVYNSLGQKVVHTTTNTSEMTIDLNNFSNGVYLLKANYDNNIVYRKLLKE